MRNFGSGKSGRKGEAEKERLMEKVCGAWYDDGLTADEEAEYEKEVVLDLSSLAPTVAFPHLPSNVRFAWSTPASTAVALVTTLLSPSGGRDSAVCRPSAWTPASGTGNRDMSNKHLQKLAFILMFRVWYYG